jgi:structural maintenance of chromosome 2
VTAELAERRKASKGAGQEFTALQKEWEEGSRKVAELQAKLDGLKEVDDAAYNAATQGLRQADAAAQDLREKYDSAIAKIGDLNFEYMDPERNFDRSRVFGLVATVFSVIDPAHTTALEVAAGGRLYNVIVDAEITGKLLLDKGRLKKRVTIIPLNKISAKTPPERAIARASSISGDKAHLALSLVGYDDQVRAAMAYVFGSTFVCDNTDAAKAVAFDKEVRARSVTLEGDVYDPSGTLTGGSRAPSSVLKRLSDLKELDTRVRAAEQHAAELRTALGAMEPKVLAARETRRTLELKTHELELLNGRIKQSPHHVAMTKLQELEKQLQEAGSGLDGLKAKEKAAKEQVEELEERSRTFESQKAGNTKEIEKQIAGAKTKAAAALKKAKAQQNLVEKIKLELAELQNDLSGAVAADAAAEGTIKALLGQLDAQGKTLQQQQAQHGEANAALEKKRESLAATDKSIAELQQQRERHSKDLVELDVEAKKLEHKMTRFAKDRDEAQAFIASIESKYSWVPGAKASFGKPDTDFDFRSRDPHKAQERLHKIGEEQTKLSKSINRKVMSMFEKAEGEYKSLVEKKGIIENDKTKLLAVIAELDERKNEALKKTHEKVTMDFGSIFSLLLPGTQAKLQPPEGQTVLDGLEVRVAFGDVWKESLTELSGGQRSLLALSLILALLRFKPAPMYILDEIDAALDLSHTQNIGHMLRQHFAKSQFIIVSLKEGMFNHANVLFKTKFVDGVSVVTRTVPTAIPHAPQKTKQGRTQ